MLRYFFEKFLFQIVLIAAVVLFVGVFLYAYVTEDTGPMPGDVRQEFSASLGRPSVAAGEDGPLARRHLSVREVGMMLDEIIAESLSLDGGNYQAVVSQASRHFAPRAYEQYKAFLQSAGFERVLSDRTLRAGVFVEAQPLELNALVQNGVFKWLYEVPVTVSFVPVGPSGYTGDQINPQNRRYNLRLQLTRVQDTQNPERVVIEIWEARAVR